MIATTPVSDITILGHRIIRAKVASKRADADLAQASTDAATARHRLADLEAEYRTLRNAA